MSRESCTSERLQAICLESLKICPGFEAVDEIVIQPRITMEGGANWTLAAVRPRVDNKVLRSARDTIESLRDSYELDPEGASVQPRRRARI
jgi:hypothetical protein